jgi:hypothetical protein
MAIAEHEKLMTEAELMALGSDMIQVYKDGRQMDVEALFPGLVLTLEAIFKLPELG